MEYCGTRTLPEKPFAVGPVTTAAGLTTTHHGPNPESTVPSLLIFHFSLTTDYINSVMFVAQVSMLLTGCVMHRGIDHVTFIGCAADCGAEELTESDDNDGIPDFAKDTVKKVLMPSSLRIERR